MTNPILKVLGVLPAIWLLAFTASSIQGKLVHAEEKTCDIKEVKVLKEEIHRLTLENMAIRSICGKRCIMNKNP